MGEVTTPARPKWFVALINHSLNEILIINIGEVLILTLSIFTALWTAAALTPFSIWYLRKISQPSSNHLVLIFWEKIMALMDSIFYWLPLFRCMLVKSVTVLFAREWKTTKNKNVKIKDRFNFAGVLVLGPWKDTQYWRTSRRYVYSQTVTRFKPGVNPEMIFVTSSACVKLLSIG